MTYLFAWSLGPVQDFIKSARKGRDLWFGSTLLSRLSYGALGELEARGRVLMPSTGSGVTGGTPNRLLALIEGEPDEVAQAIKLRVEGDLKKVAEAAFTQFEGQLKAHAKELRTPEAKGGRLWFRDQAMAQVADLPEITWAAVQLGPSLRESHLQLQALLSARKSHRPFRAATWGGPAFKSRLDGARESVLPANLLRHADEALLQRAANISRGEHLCGVGLLKRFGRHGLKALELPTDEAERGGRIDSTSHFAAKSWLVGIPTEQHTKARTLVAHYCDLLGRADVVLSDLTTFKPHPVLGRLDGHALYSSRLGDFVPRKHRQQVEAGLGELLSKLKTLMEPGAPPEPSPYYAVLFADGDHVGKALDQVDDEKEFTRFSSALQDFATRARHLVEDEHEGGLIYAGGDDVSALVPLHRVLGCASGLRDAFHECMKPVAGASGQVPTLSVGVAVAHHLWPLQDALDLARKAEDLAKGEGQDARDALAVVLQPRSGPPRTARVKWAEFSHFERAFRWSSEGVLPGGLAHELVEAGRRLPEDEHRLHDAEARRIIARKRVDGGALPAEVQAALLGLVAGRGLEPAANLLLVARALSRPGGEV